jgi:hypothetical protein
VDHVVAGAADVVSAVFRSTILQTTVPDNLRGRMSAVHILVVVGGPRVGDVEAGLVAALTTPTITVLTGGLACIIGVGVHHRCRRARARRDAARLVRHWAHVRSFRLDIIAHEARRAVRRRRGRRHERPTQLQRCPPGEGDDRS